MSTQPTPQPTPATDPLATLLAGLKSAFSVGVTLPGESLLVAFFDFAKAERTTMNQVNRDAFDAIFVQQAQDLQAVWRHLWQLAGVIPK